MFKDLLNKLQNLSAYVPINLSNIPLFVTVPNLRLDVDIITFIQNEIEL